MDWPNAALLSRFLSDVGFGRTNLIWFGQILGRSGQLVGWAKSVGSEQVLGAGLPGEGWEGEDRQNSWINIAPSPSTSHHPNSLSFPQSLSSNWRGGERKATFSAWCELVCGSVSCAEWHVYWWSAFDPLEMTGHCLPTFSYLTKQLNHDWLVISMYKYVSHLSLKD